MKWYIIDKYWLIYAKKQYTREHIGALYIDIRDRPKKWGTGRFRMDHNSTFELVDILKYKPKNAKWF